MILGGYNWINAERQTNYFLQRKYEDLPLHKTILFSMIFYTLDSWDPTGEHVQILFDSLADFVKVESAFEIHPRKICGRSRTDGFMLLHGSLPHTSPTLTLKFKTTLSSETFDESFGVREIHLQFTQEELPFSYCADSSEITPGYPAEWLNCFCQQNQFKDSHDVCLDCDESCESCFALGPESCYRCNLGFYFEGGKCTKCPGGQILNQHLQCKGNN